MVEVIVLVMALIPQPEPAGLQLTVEAPLGADYTLTVNGQRVRPDEQVLVQSRTAEIEVVWVAGDVVRRGKFRVELKRGFVKHFRITVPASARVAAV